MGKWVISKPYLKNSSNIQTLPDTFSPLRTEYYLEYLDRVGLNIHYPMGMTIPTCSVQGSNIEWDKKKRLKINSDLIQTFIETLIFPPINNLGDYFDDPWDGRKFFDTQYLLLYSCLYILYDRLLSKFDFNKKLLMA